MNSNTSFFLKNVHDHFIMNIVKYKFNFQFKKPELGRWNLSNSKLTIDKKIDYANYDNCFTVINKK